MSKPPTKVTISTTIAISFSKIGSFGLDQRIRHCNDPDPDPDPDPDHRPP